MTVPPSDALTCFVQVSHTEAEYPSIFAAVEALAMSRGMVLALDRENFVYPEDQSWVTRWDNDEESIRLVELKNLDGTPWGVAFDVLQVSIDR